RLDTERRAGRDVRAHGVVLDAQDDLTRHVLEVRPPTEGRLIAHRGLLRAPAASLTRRRYGARGLLSTAASNRERELVWRKADVASRDVGRDEGRATSGSGACRRLLRGRARQAPRSCRRGARPLARG